MVILRKANIFQTPRAVIYVFLAIKMVFDEKTNFFGANSFAEVVQFKTLQSELCKYLLLSGYAIHCLIRLYKLIYVAVERDCNL